jgi:membrane-bound metal-dependent hydrolase YbcI (DUF457 family)
VLYGALAVLGASLVDIDHVVAAQSLSFHRLETMPLRPDSHALLVATAFAAIAWVITRRRLMAWSIFAVTVAHLLSDAVGGGTPLLYPFSRADAIPWLVLPGGIALLFALSALMSRSLLDLPPASQHSRMEAGRFVWRARPVAARRRVAPHEERVLEKPARSGV